MANKAIPRQEIIYLWSKKHGRDTYPYITRAYHRLNGKFVPIGYYLDDRKFKSMLVTDSEIADVDFRDLDF